jgi:hypothetical protein
MTPIDADFDEDGDSDMLDFLTLQTCFAGTSRMIEPGCASCDIDRDGDVDLKDYEAFEFQFAGCP